MKHLSGKVAAITGAGSGIGRALAVNLANRGTALALSDVDSSGLAQTVQQCEGRGVKVSAGPLDVSDNDAVVEWAASVVDDHGRVNLVFNNAGVALGSNIEQMSYEDFEWLMGINFWGVVYGTKAFLPHLKQTGDGHIVNISSVFGLLSIPSQSAYNSAKFGVRGFTDALRMELEMEQCGVSATTVHPGGIKTNIAKSARVDASIVEQSGGTLEAASARMERAFITTPGKAAQQIIRAVERNRRRALIGPDAIGLDLLSRLPAAVSQRLIMGVAQRA